jgi:hypothetical protein
VTNNGGLTDPGSLPYTSNPAGLSDGDPVSTWLDSSVNGNNATMTGSNRPTFKTGIVNGHPVVRFTSTGQSKLNLTTPISGNWPWTIFVVMKPASGTTRIDSLDGSDGGSPRGPLTVTTGATATAYLFDRDGYIQFTGAISLAFHVFTGVAPSSGAKNLYVDGTSSIGSPTPSASTGNFITLGYDSIAPTYCDGDIAELLVIQGVVLSATDRQNAEKTLSVKYGTPAPPAGSVIDLLTLPGMQGWWKADSLG